MAFEQVLEQLEGRLTGVREEGERIKLHIMPLEECWHSTPDCEPLLPHAARTPTMIRQEQEGEQEGEEENEDDWSRTRHTQTVRRELVTVACDNGLSIKHLD